MTYLLSCDKNFEKYDEVNLQIHQFSSQLAQNAVRATKLMQNQENKFHQNRSFNFEDVPLN
jgi:hypothetical protein